MLKFSQILPFTPASGFMSGTVVVCTCEAGGGVGGAEFIAWPSCVFTVLVKHIAVGWPGTWDQSWLFKHFITC